MAQYKAAMLRIFGEGATKSGSAAAASASTSSSTSQFAATETTNNSTLQSSQEEYIDDGSDRRYEDVNDGNNNMHSNQAIHQQPPPMIKYIRESWATSLLDIFLPLVWVLIFAMVMTRESFFSLIYMPFLGVFAAVLANCVPIGGGIVYIPALSLLGTHVHLSVSFTVATMSVGNGILGALRWLIKDPSLIIYESFEWTVIPSSIGSLIALLFLEKPHVYVVKRGFAVFCIVLGGYVLVMLRKRMNNSSDHRYHHLHADNRNGKSSGSDSSSGGGTGGGTGNGEDSSTSRPRLSRRVWGIFAMISFLMGLVVVPNIGIGPAMTTFLLLKAYGYTEQEAMVTGIITGGLVCWIPFILHLVVFKDVDFALWIMVLPGVYYGAKWAPLAHEKFGIINIMWAFAAFLFATAGLFSYI